MTRKTTVEDFERLFIPEPNSGCWLWLGSTNKGYGRKSYHGKLEYGHRLSYKLYIGPISDEMELDHLCRTPCCVNPDHLEPVSHTENVRRHWTTQSNFTGKPWLAMGIGKATYYRRFVWKARNAGERVSP